MKSVTSTFHRHPHFSLLCLLIAHHTHFSVTDFKRGLHMGVNHLPSKLYSQKKDRYLSDDSGEILFYKGYYIYTL